jgi:quercetin dioxygenase-like cupin family protein/DNA-binding XRE family transcriptional regulator
MLKAGRHPARRGDPDAPTIDELGGRIASRRSDRGLTIAALGAQADVSPGLISQIERGVGNPSYSTLVKLAAALEVPFTDFFPGVMGGSHGLVRHGQRATLQLEGGVEYEMLTPTMSGRVGIVRVTISPEWSNQSSPSGHEGDETVTVIHGDLTVWTGEEAHRLREGDAITFDAAEPHWMRNSGDVTAVVIITTTPPSL